MIKINFEKAKEIKKEQLRNERIKEFERLDMEIQKYMFTDEFKCKELEIERQKLRDITNKVDILETIEELKEFSI